MMPVLVITNRGEGRSLLLGNRQLSKRASAYWGPGSAVEFAQRIALEDPSKFHRVKRIVIPVDAVKCFGPFLLRMYLPDSATMLPGEEIFLEKVVPTRQMVRKNKAYVDVSHQEITVRDVPFFYVSFSWLPEARSGDECLTIMGVTRKDSVEATECVIRTSSFDFQPWNAGRDKDGMPQLLNTFFSVEAEGFAQVS
ncbi:MAG TPA: hypothetical protein VFZ78_05555, partial [Flavisolibacter sp.]